MIGTTLWTRYAIYLVLIAFCRLLSDALLRHGYHRVEAVHGPERHAHVGVADPTDVGWFHSGLAEVAPNFRNSVIITVPAAIISAFIGSINGYIFAKWRFPHSDLIFSLFLVGMFLPYQGILIPLVQDAAVLRPIWNDCSA